MMTKFNLKALADEMKSSLSDMETINVGLGDEIGTVSESPEDFVVLPSWFKDAYGVLGLQFGRIVQVAGDSDTGKTTFAMQSMKSAQDQGFAVLYTETEGKTPIQYFQNWDIDPAGVMLVQSQIAEEAFDASFAYIEKFFENYPDAKLLWVYDSYGNTVSLSDAENDVSDASRPGGSAKTNRKALNKLVAMRQKYPIACLIINYTYDNIGSHGKTNAGGKALNFFATLTIQTSRIGWVKGVVKGQNVRKGVKVKWSVFKNHYEQALRDSNGSKIQLPDAIELSITDEGMKRIDAGAKKVDEPKAKKGKKSEDTEE